MGARTRGRYGRIRPGAVAALWLGVVRGALAPPASVPRPGFVPGRNHLGGTGRPCRFGAGLLIALAAVASGVPTFAQSNTLVSNLTQTQHANALSLFAWDAVQGFETGAGCHTLTSVELRLRRGGAAAVVAVPDVKVMEGTKTGSGVTFAGQSITLTGEETEIASGATAEYTFTAPAGTTLKESTRYFVVAEAPGPIAEWATTALPGEDAGGATGWFIDDKRWRRAANSAGSFTQRNRVQMLRVNGSTSNRAAPASAQDEDEIVHGRVLMDTTLTLGTYDEATAFAAADHWGYIDPTACGFAAGTAGSLGDADFVWRGVEYTVVALAVKGTSSVVLDIEDAAGTDLPATASIGVELTSGGGDAYLVPWPQYSTGHSDLIGRPELALRRLAADRGGDATGGPHPRSRSAGLVEGGPRVHRRGQLCDRLWLREFTGATRQRRWHQRRTRYSAANHLRVRRRCVHGGPAAGEDALPRTRHRPSVRHDAGSPSSRGVSPGAADDGARPRHRVPVRA